MNHTRKFIVTASAIALAVVAIGAVAMLTDRASAADPPLCPASWPSEPNPGAVPTDRYGRISHEGFHTDSNGDEWYVVRDTDSNGNTHGRAYRADRRYRTGYQPGSPDEVCYAKLRRRGDATDFEQPEQVTFPPEREETLAEPERPVTIRQILASLSPADQAAAILCLLQIAGNTDPDTFLDDPANVPAAIAAGCLPAP